MQAGRHAVRSQMGHAEVDRPFQVLPNRADVLIRKGNLLVQVSDVARFRDVFVYRREQP